MQRSESELSSGFGRRAVRVGAVVLAVVLAAGCASTREDRKEVEFEQHTFSFEADMLSIATFTDYRIAPGDLLDVLYQIKTWEEKESFKLAVDHEVSVKFPKMPELNEAQRVRPDGKISLPYLGEVYVVDKTITGLTDELKAEYAKIVKEPELYIVVPEFRAAIKELKIDLHTAPRGLSRLVTVRPDGHATFSMLGDIDVAGKTVPEVNKELNEKYDLVLPGLSVDLFLEQTEGSLVYVLGQVFSPGGYKVLKPTSVLESLALAGGTRPAARLGSVIVMRKHEDKMVATRVNVAKALRMSKKGKYFYIQPDDIVYVPQRFISRAAQIASELQQIIFFNGWGVDLSYDLNEDKTATEATVEAVVGP